MLDECRVWEAGQWMVVRLSRSVDRPFEDREKSKQDGCYSMDESSDTTRSLPDIVGTS